MKLPNPSDTAPITRWLDGHELTYGFTNLATRHILRAGQVAALLGRKLSWRVFSNLPACSICKHRSGHR